MQLFLLLYHHNEPKGCLHSDTEKNKQNYKKYNQPDCPNKFKWLFFQANRAGLTLFYGSKLFLVLPGACPPQTFEHDRSPCCTMSKTTCHLPREMYLADTSLSCRSQWCLLAFEEDFGVLTTNWSTRNISFLTRYGGLFTFTKKLHLTSDDQTVFASILTYLPTCRTTHRVPVWLIECSIANDRWFLTSFER